jgi:hypothetical protein
MNTLRDRWNKQRDLKNGGNDLLIGPSDPENTSTDRRNSQHDLKNTPNDVIITSSDLMITCGDLRSQRDLDGSRHEFIVHMVKSSGQVGYNTH